MNIIHNSTQKFVPNTIFAQFIDHQLDYCQDNQNQTYHNNKSNMLASTKKGTSLQQPSLFQDKTNLQAQFKTDSEKHTPVMKLIPKKLYIESNPTHQFTQPISQVTFDQSAKFRKLKQKKKFSPLKKNLQQLFDGISDKAEKDCIFVEDNNQGKEQRTSSSNKNYGLSQKNENSNQKKKVIKDGKQEQPAESQSDQSQKYSENQNNGLFNVKKFHFLHNQLNLDSSSDEQDDKIDQQARGSSSSENDGQNIDLMMPKIIPRHKFFIKKEDLNLDSSDESQEEQKQVQGIEQTPQTKDHIKKQQQNNQKLSQQKSSRIFNITDFRRQFVQSNQEYLKKSLPYGVTIDFIIKRDKSKKNSDSIEYQLYDSKTLRTIVVVAKKSGVHEIMAKKNIQDPKAHPDMKYLTAKLESNFLGSEFILKYVPRPNQQPNKISKPQQTQEIAATVCYETNILGLKGPRKMNIYIPENDSVKYYGDKTLEQHYLKNCNHRIDKYINKQAKWNKDVQSYVLNMKGKAKLSSVKNFVIVRDDQGHECKGSQEQEKSFVIFGKISKEIFNLSISGPFSIIQGLSLALSTFERKLMCE